MPSVFFGQLPEPDIFAGGSGSQATQTGAIMKAYEEVLEDQNLSLSGCWGCKFHRLCCTAKKGLCRWPMLKPAFGLTTGICRRVNRVVTMHWLTTSSQQVPLPIKPLVSGVSNDRIFCWQHYDRHPLDQPRPSSAASLLATAQRGAYFLLTLHRPSNVDDAETFAALMNHRSFCQGCPIVFVVHPRTRGTLDK